MDELEPRDVIRLRTRCREGKKETWMMAVVAVAVWVCL